MNRVDLVRLAQQANGLDQKIAQVRTSLYLSPITDDEILQRITALEASVDMLNNIITWLYETSTEMPILEEFV